jgi:DNA-binding PadR family transcriptional regulator
MFDDQFGEPAFGFAGDDPHDHGPHSGHHGPWNRGPFGGRGPWQGGPFGGPGMRSFWGMFGGPGGGRRGPGMFGRGDLKYVLLELLQERPKHGYEMIKELEQRAGGLYSPSAGAIYPTLQMLEDRGWVTSESVEGKKVYTITDAGRQAMAERAQQDPGPRGGPHHHGPRGPRGPEGPGGPFFGAPFPPEMMALGQEGFEVARLLRDALFQAQGDPAKLEQIRTIVRQTRQALETLVRGGSGSGSGATDTPKPPTPPEIV